TAVSQVDQADGLPDVAGRGGAEHHRLHVLAVDEIVRLAWRYGPRRERGHGHDLAALRVVATGVLDVAFHVRRHQVADLVERRADDHVLDPSLRQQRLQARQFLGEQPRRHAVRPPDPVAVLLEDADGSETEHQVRDDVLQEYHLHVEAAKRAHLDVDQHLYRPDLVPRQQAQAALGHHADGAGGPGPLEQHVPQGGEHALLRDQVRVLVGIGYRGI